MSYLQFHLVFILPPLVLLLLWARPRGKALIAYLLIPAIALVYTTPWDNFLVAREVWGYPDGRVLFTIGYVPVEEYLFFVLQPLLTGALAYKLAAASPPPASGPGLARVIGGGAALLVAALGVMLLALGDEALYLGLILAYFAPVFVLQWAFGGDLLWAWRRVLFLAVAIPTLYLWLADWFAITRAGIWWIADAWTLGVEPFGLPLEEATFFLVTNLAVVQGLLLAWHPASLERLK